MAVTFNHLVLFSSRCTCFGLFPICCFQCCCCCCFEIPALKQNIWQCFHSKPTVHLLNWLIDVFIIFMKKICSSPFRARSNSWSETNMNITVETMGHSELSRYGNIKAFRCSLSLNKVLCTYKHCKAFLYFSVLHFIFGIQLKTRCVVLLFENYSKKSLTSGRGEILTIVNNSISPGFFELTLYPKHLIKLVLVIFISLTFWLFASFTPSLLSDAVAEKKWSYQPG